MTTILSLGFILKYCKLCFFSDSNSQMNNFTTWWIGLLKTLRSWTWGFFCNTVCHSKPLGNLELSRTVSHLTYHIPAGKKKPSVLKDIRRIILSVQQEPSLFVSLCKDLYVELARTFLIRELPSIKDLDSLTYYLAFKRKTMSHLCTYVQLCNTQTAPWSIYLALHLPPSYTE